MSKRNKRKKLKKEIKNQNCNTKGPCKDKNKKELVYEYIYLFIMKNMIKYPQIL